MTAPRGTSYIALLHNVPLEVLCLGDLPGAPFGVNL